METGIVVDNFDPRYKGRCKIRVYGLHTETVCGKYVILDDDLPWAKPSNSGGTDSGNFSVPKVGQRVYVEVIDPFTILYNGPVETKSDIKSLLYENADDCENFHSIICEGNPGNDRNGDYVKIYYLPEEGLNIECHGHQIQLTKYDGLIIKSKNGIKIQLDENSQDINVDTEGTVNLNCNKVNLTSDATEKLILGNKLMEKFNNHTHFCPGGTTTQPIQKITPLDFSKKIKIG